METAASHLNSLCDQFQLEDGSLPDIDVLVAATGSTYHLHRIVLSRSSYFRNMLHGPWKEAGAPTVTLHVDDTNVNGEAIAMALAYLYGHHPKLDDDNAFRVLAAASFLDLQDLCAICTDFIISGLRTSNFLAYQTFPESQDYGIHGERVRDACWGYLCQSGAMELKEVLPKLSSQTLHALLTSDELWVRSEEERFELALYTFLAKTNYFKGKLQDEENSSAVSGSIEGKGLTDTGEESETLANVFEGGYILYSNMSFEALINVRKHLEEMGFPCKAVHDGLWQQMLLRQRVQEIGADTCENCCLVSMACACRQQFVFSRGLNASGWTRADRGGDLTGDGLTALVGQTERDAGPSVAGPFSLDMKTALNDFPPFRFAVEFQEVHRLVDGQVKHSVEVFYAGSLWKVSVQAFNDKDPQGRRTLGLFLHRRKAEIADPLRKAHMYMDSREKVTARCQLICPSKREVMVFGNFKQPGTLLPKAPKGWGWSTALLFDELGDLLQNGALRVAAVVQLV